MNPEVRRDPKRFHTTVCGPQNDPPVNICSYPLGDRHSRLHERTAGRDLIRDAGTCDNCRPRLFKRYAGGPARSAEEATGQLETSRRLISLSVRQKRILQSQPYIINAF